MSKRSQIIVVKLRKKVDGHNLLEVTASQWIAKLQVALKKVDTAGFFLVGVDYNDPDYGLKDDFDDE